MDPLHAVKDDLQKGLAEKYKNVQIGTPDEQMMQPPPAKQEGQQQNQNSQQTTQSQQTQQNNGSQSAESNSSLNGATDANKGQEEKKEEVKIPAFEDLLSEKSGGKFKAWEEVQSLLDAPKTEFSNETVKKFNDFAKEIGDEELALDLFVQHQRNDYDKMSHEELVVMQLAIDNPKLNDEEIEALYMAKYNVHKWAQSEEEEVTQDQKAWEAMMKADGEKARDLLRAQRQKVLLENKRPDPKVEQEKEAKLHQAWVKESDTALKGFDKFPITVTDGEGKDLEKFDLVVTPEMATSLQKFSHQAGKDFAEAIKPFVMNEKGDDVDHRKVHEVGFILQNYQSLLKAASRQGYALGAKGVAANLKNVDMTRENSNATEGKTQEQLNRDAIRTAMQKDGLL